jgi:hypothetical protein
MTFRRILHPLKKKKKKKERNRIPKRASGKHSAERNI